MHTKSLRRLSPAEGRRRPARNLALALALALAAACGDATGPTNSFPDGLWVGSTEEYSLGIVLTEYERTHLSGSGSMASTTIVHAVTVTGNHVHPHVSLTLSIRGFQDINFQGRFMGESRIVGELNGAGFNDLAFTVQRQQ